MFSSWVLRYLVGLVGGVRFYGGCSAVL